MKKQVKISFLIMCDWKEDKDNYTIGLPLSLSKFITQQKFRKFLMIIKDKGGKVSQ